MTNDQPQPLRPPPLLEALLATPPLRLPGDVHVVVLSSRKAEPLISRLEGFLGENERQRSAALSRPHRRRRFVTARAALRMILTALCESAVSETAWRFGSSALGKPHIREPGDGSPSFNLSYGGPFIAIAVSRTSSIGADIETEHAIPADEIPWHLFAENEQRQLRRSSPEEFPPAFFRLWTLKEAIAKQTGQGFTTEFSEIDTTELAVIDDIDRIDEPPADGGLLLHVPLDLEGRPVHLAICAASSN